VAGGARPRATFNSGSTDAFDDNSVKRRRQTYEKVRSGN
jgi:hypothetical protein